MTKKNKEEPKPTVTPGLAFTDMVFEQLNNGYFAVFNRETNEVVSTTAPHVLHDGIDYVPLARLPWPSTGPSEIINDNGLAENREELMKRLQEQKFTPDSVDPEQLFNEIRQFFVDHLDVSNDLLFDVYACFVLASWRVEDFSVVPYSFFIGPLASGKTRAEECHHRLCYRSVMAASMSAASIFRILEAWHVTLCLDETEIYNKESMVEVLALLNSGYRRGQYAIRIEKLEEGCPQIAMFDTFGMKILSGTEELAATLQSRCILTTMSKAVRHIRFLIDEERANKLRNKLLMYRFENLGKNLDKFDINSLNGKMTNSRVAELFLSLLHVAPTDEIRARLLECMNKITQSRLDEEQASIEARVFDAFLKCFDKVEGGKISTQEITNAFNFGLPEKEQVNSRFISRRVAALGFERCRLTGGLSGFFWDEQQVDRLRARYFPANTPSSKQASLSSLSSLSSLNTEEKAATSEVSEENKSPEKTEKPLKSEVSEDSEVSEGNLKTLASTILKLERLSTHIEDKCLGCGFQGRMDWQLTEHDGSWGLLCDRCGLQIERLGQHG